MREHERTGARPSDSRSADAYIEAVNAVIGLAEMAIPQLKKRGGGAAKIAGAVEGAVPYVRAAAEQLPAVVPIVAPTAKKVAGIVSDKVPGALEEGAGRIAGAAMGAGAALGGAAGTARDSVMNAAEARAQERARKLARKTLLDGAGTRFSAEKFLENWSLQAKVPEGHEGYLAYPGCYVIITCDGAVRKDDYSRYRDLYVGKSENMGAAIYDDFAGRGNPDVYADVKYKQHVYVLLYPCEKGKMDDLEASLITALDADESYNRS